MHRIQQFKSNYQKICNDTKGSDFQKALALLAEYCGYNSIIPFNIGCAHTNVIEKIIKYYLSIANDNNVVLKSIPCMLFLIQSLLVKKVESTDDLVDIFAIIKANTGFDAHHFRRNSQIYRMFDPIFGSLVSYLSNKDKFYFAYINIKIYQSWIDAFIESDDYLQDITSLCDRNIIKNIDILNYIVRDLPNRFAYDWSIAGKRASLLGLFLQLEDINLNEMAEQFNGFLHANKFPHAFYIAYKASGEIDLLMNEVISDNYQNLSRMLDKLFPSLINKIPREIILKIKSHMHCNETTLLYVDMINKRDIFKDWQNIEEKFISTFNVDFHKALYIAIDRPYVTVVQYLLKNKNEININHIVNPWDDKVRIQNPLQYILKRMLDNFVDSSDQQNFRDSSFELIKALIVYKPNCLFVKNNEEETILDYVDKLKHKFKWLIKSESYINQICTLITDEYNKNRNFFFFLGRKDPNSSLNQLPNDVYFYMFGMFKSIENNKNLASVENTTNGNDLFNRPRKLI